MVTPVNSLQPTEMYTLNGWTEYYVNNLSSKNSPQLPEEWRGRTERLLQRGRTEARKDSWVEARGGPEAVWPLYKEGGVGNRDEVSEIIIKQQKVYLKSSTWSTPHVQKVPWIKYIQLSARLSWLSTITPKHTGLKVLKTKCRLERERQERPSLLIFHKVLPSFLAGGWQVLKGPRQMGLDWRAS